MEMIEVIFIDAKNMSISNMFIKPTLRSYYDLIGCELIESVNSQTPDLVMYVDEEGLLKNPEHFIMVDWFPQPIAGSAVIIGMDEDGNDRSTKFTVADLKGKVKFMNLDEVKSWANSQYARAKN